MTALLRTCVPVLLAFALALGGCASPPPAPATPPQPLPPPPVTIKQQEVSPKERAKLHTELAAGYYERGRMDVAIEELGEAAKLDPNEPRIYNLYGLVYAMLGEEAKAEQNFQRALAMAPQNPDFHHNWGWYLCSSGRPREAMPEFEFALRDPLYKTPEVAMINAGRCSLALGDVAGADSYFRRAVAVAPNNPQAIYGVALVSFKLGRPDDARTWIRRLTQQPPVPPEALYLAMCIEKKSGDRGAEQSYISQLKNRYPDSAEAKAIPTGICE
jgi:type IV pilus assembly protein PilF